jgi:transcriptional regulator with PAS, ATPase and Fis domain
VGEYSNTVLVTGVTNNSGETELDMNITKKKIFIAGHTRQTCESFRRCVLEFLGEYVDVEAWNMQDYMTPPPSLDGVDLVLVATIEARDFIRTYYAKDKPILIGERILGAQNLDKLLGLENNTRVYAVGSTSATTENTIKILKNLGFDKLEWVQCFPGMGRPLDAGIMVAVTPGLPNLAPPNIKQVIDVGAKEISISTFAEIIRCLAIPVTLLDKISNFYVNTILTNVKDISIVGMQNKTLKNQLEAMLNSLQEAIVGLDEHKRVVAYNYATEKIFGVPVGKAMGSDWETIYPQSLLASCIDSGEGISGKLKLINGNHYMVNANVVFDGEGVLRGVVGTFQLAEKIKDLDIQVRSEMRCKAHTAKYTFEDIVGSSAELRKAISLAAKFAGTELTILLEGESGTGKELFAQAIHNQSARRARPFLGINFAAIPDNLIESELFGYEDGAFTGAKKGGKAGVFEETHLGTIFIDEIGSATPEVQNRLLRVLEEQEIRRIGSGRNTPVDVRVIAATNVDLAELVQRNQFRIDLYYRLCTLPIFIPPLRERGGDVEYLANKFVRDTATGISFDSKVMEFFSRYEWPGNIRELQNVIKYFCNVVEPGESATIEDLPPYLFRKFTGANRAVLRADNLSTGKVGIGNMGIAGLNVDAKLARLPATFDKPEVHRILLIILGEMEQNKSAFKGVGYVAISKRVRDLFPNTSEYSIKKILQMTRDLGFAEAGKTKQGTAITAAGEELLRRLKEIYKRKFVGLG